MKLLLFFLLTITVSFSTFAQNENCDALIISDSLFQQQSDAYNFDIKTNNIVHNVLRDQIDNINHIVSLEGNCLKFRISFACGCGTIKTQLVSNGKLQQDAEGRNFYRLKLLFTNSNKGCKALCHERLAFDVSDLKKQSSKVYLKFEDIEGLIVI